MTNVESGGLPWCRAVCVFAFDPPKVPFLSFPPHPSFVYSSPSFSELRTFIPLSQFCSPWNTGDSRLQTLWISWLFHAEGYGTSFHLHVLKWRLQWLSFLGVPSWAVMKQRHQLFLGQRWVLPWCWVGDGTAIKRQQRYALLNSRENLFQSPITWKKETQLLNFTLFSATFDKFKPSFYLILLLKEY